jgi:hypothetical protein
LKSELRIRDAQFPMRDTMSFAREERWDRLPLRQRAAGLIVTLLIEALIILAILNLGRQPTPPTDSGAALVTIQMTAAHSPAKAQKSPEQPKVHLALPKAQPPPIPPLPKVPKPTNPQDQPPPPSKAFVEVSKADFAAMDISKFGSKSGAHASGPSATMGPGEGPNGQPLYNAEWVREPSDGELAPYFAETKSRPPGAWAMVACKTIENFHVENCQPLGESPPGTGLAKALRLAAWQFLVRPPRIGNKPQLGVWVRIRFDFNKDATGPG